MCTFCGGSMVIHTLELLCAIYFLFFSFVPFTFFFFFASCIYCRSISGARISQDQFNKLEQQTLETHYLTLVIFHFNCKQMKVQHTHLMLDKWCLPLIYVQDLETKPPEFIFIKMKGDLLTISKDKLTEDLGGLQFKMLHFALLSYRHTQIFILPFLNKLPQLGHVSYSSEAPIL